MPSTSCVVMPAVHRSASAPKITTLTCRQPAVIGTSYAPLAAWRCVTVPNTLTQRSPASVPSRFSPPSKPGRAPRKLGNARAAATRIRLVKASCVSSAATRKNTRFLRRCPNRYSRRYRLSYKKNYAGFSPHIAPLPYTKIWFSGMSRLC